MSPTQPSCSAEERIDLAVGRASERLALRLSAVARGRGALLYLHGFGSVQAGEKAEFFRARSVPAGWTFCSLDFRGHGESGGSMRELTLARNLEDVAAAHALLAERGWPEVVLVGSSMGGATALWYAAEHPRSVVAGVHIAPAVGMRSGLERWAGEAGLARWRREGALRFRNAFVDADLGWELVEDLRRRDFRALAARTRTPTLVFQGVLDDTVDWRDVAEFARLAPPDIVELVLYPDGDHRLTDRKETLWEATRSFLEALPPSAQRAAAKR